MLPESRLVAGDGIIIDNIGGMEIVSAVGGAVEDTVVNESSGSEIPNVEDDGDMLIGEDSNWIILSAATTDDPYEMWPADSGQLTAQTNAFPTSAVDANDSVSWHGSRQAWNGTTGTLERFECIITIPRRSGITITAETKTIIDTAEDCDTDVTGVAG